MVAITRPHPTGLLSKGTSSCHAHQTILCRPTTPGARPHTPKGHRKSEADLHNHKRAQNTFENPAQSLSCKKSIRRSRPTPPPSKRCLLPTPSHLFTPNPNPQGTLWFQAHWPIDQCPIFLLVQSLPIYIRSCHLRSLQVLKASKPSLAGEGFWQ